MRTSTTHPLEIANIQPAQGHGFVGITFCPGKVQQNALTGTWSRDLGVDLDVIGRWNASAMVTLVEAHELAALKVSQLGKEVLNRQIDWYHLPIRDRDVPDPTFEALWGTQGEELRARLRSGFNVLVHCMGGLGRAGTIASRLLIELGCDPAQAVSKVRSVRPGAIETSGQLAYVMGLAQVPEAVPETSIDAIRDRAIGAMIGLAVGDAVGTTLEFTARDSCPRVEDMIGGGPFRLAPGQWTDDTSMSLALADSLVAKGCLDEADLMERFGSWHEQGTYSSTGECFDIGITTRQALARWKRTGDPVAGSTDPMSAGNGSLMRLAPVAVRYWRDRPTMRDAAARQSRTTHAASEAVDACVAFVEALGDAIEGRPRSEVLRGRAEPYVGAIAAITAGSWRGKHRDHIRASGYVAHSLEAALWNVGRTGSVEQAILLAANLGEDADTTAAITGQLAGALHGTRAIPKRWLDRLACRETLEGMARKLFNASIG